MSELFQPFNFREIVIDPWTKDGSLTLWIVLMGFLVTASCGLVGKYLILRRMALMGDAISHSILPGLAAAFLVASLFSGPSSDGLHHGQRHPVALFAGALAAGLLTTVLIELIHKNSRVKQDAAIGIIFSSLFALGVILISVFADHVDLDADCVLYGEIAFVPLEPPIEFWGMTLGPPSVFRMGVVTLLTAALVVAFYKELLVSSFDSGLAASLGINANVMHYALMSWLSIVVVSAFEAVGAILVVAMLILPGATASMVSHRLPVILALVPPHAALTAVLGRHLSLWLNCSTAGAMVTVAAMLFCLAWLLSPTDGLLAKWRRARAPIEPMPEARIGSLP